MAYASPGGISTLALNGASGSKDSGMPFAGCLNAVEPDIGRKQPGMAGPFLNVACAGLLAGFTAVPGLEFLAGARP